MSDSSFISGWVAGRTLASSIAFWVLSLRVCSITSPMIDLPYRRLTWAGGTLPGRKPFKESCGLISLMRASARWLSSLADTVTPNTRLRPSPDFSTISMDMVLFFQGVPPRGSRPCADSKNVGAALAVWTWGGAKERSYVMRFRPVQAQSVWARQPSFAEAAKGVLLRLQGRDLSCEARS